MTLIKAAANKSPGLIQSVPLAESRGKSSSMSLDVKDIKAARALSTDAVMRSNGSLPWLAANSETIVGNPYTLY